MAFTRVCGVEEIPQGEMESFYLEDVGVEVLVVHSGAGLHAFYGICPHEDFPLVDGAFDGTTIVCSGHGWVFNAENGKGVNPPGCRIAEYPLKVEDGGIFVDADDELPTAASS